MKTRNFVCSAVALLALTACAVPQPGTLPIRNGTQEQDPSSGFSTVQAPSAAAQQQAADLAAMQDFVNAAAAGDAGAVTPQDILAGLAPNLGANAEGIAPALALFRETCLRAGNDVDQLEALATQAGIDVDRDGETLFGSDFASAAPISLQVNVASAFTSECAVTLAEQGDATPNARDLFFEALGRPHVDGVGTINVNGEDFILKHVAFGGGALGITENAFLLQQE
ncbi:MAG: hypothetical protein AAGF13_10530 [Pseudomonadota bacterium]